MDDWARQPVEDTRFHYERTKLLQVKKTLDFIASHPDGVTAKDFEKAGISPQGISRLMKLGQIVGKQIREPERGPRAYHWHWKIRRITTESNENKE